MDERIQRIVHAYPIPDKLIRNLGNAPLVSRPRRTMHPSLTPRMREVLALVCEGYTNAEIGKRIGCSEETVKSHVKRLLDYFQARNRAHLAAIAVSSGRVTRVSRPAPGGEGRPQ